MAMRPSTRDFLISAALALGALVLVFGRFFWFFLRALGRAGADKASQTELVILLGCFFGPIVVLGILVAWLRLLRERRERARRPAPLALE